MIDVTVDLPNIDELVKRIQEAEGDAALLMAEAIHEGADERVPVDTGSLKESGRVEARPGPAAAVIYGGPKAKHAAAVHELHPGPGKHFLRDSAMESRKLLRVAAKRLSKTFPK